MVQWLDSALPLWRMQVQSLVRELRSHKPHGAPPKKEEENRGDCHIVGVGNVS